MGIHSPLQTEVLIAFCAVSAALIIVIVWCLLKSTFFSHLIHDRVKLIAFSLLFFTVAAAMSCLLFGALAHGEAYSISSRGSRRIGEVVHLWQNPGDFWVLVVGYYVLAVPTLSFALVFAAKLIQLQLKPSDPTVKKNTESP